MLADKLVEERLFDNDSRVTVGTSAKNDICLPAHTLPRTMTLFRRGKGRAWSLRCVPGLDGRISRGGPVLTLAEATAGASSGQGGVAAVPLSEGHRGKVTLGEVTLLFQFVQPPPRAPRPQLPPSVRGGVFNSLDWVMACCFVVVFMAHGGALAYMRTLDPPVRPVSEPIDGPWLKIPTKLPEPRPDINRLAELGEKPTTKKPGPAVKDKDKGKDKDKVSKDKVSKDKVSKDKAKKPCDQGCQEKAAAARRARLARKVSTVGVLKIFGTRGQGDGTAMDRLAKGDPGQRMADAFAGMSRTTVASAAKPGIRSKGSGGTGEAVGIAGLSSRVGGPAEVDSGEMVKERVPRARVKSASPDIVDGTMNSDATYRIIRRGMRCVQATYQRGLKRDPNLNGKVAMCFTVDPMGRVGSTSVESNSVGDPLVTTGIKSCVKRLRFPPPAGGAAEVCVPFILTPANR